jgi:phosphoglycolate phosphatase-like HAD superfamily hydrolase
LQAEPGHRHRPGRRPEAGRPTDRFEGIDLVVFDKDGTLIDFDRMWSGWSADLIHKVAAATDPSLIGPMSRALGLDSADRVLPGSALAATPMGHLRLLAIETLVEAGLTPEAAGAAVAASWDPPDPVALAHPLTDLRSLFGGLQARGIRVAVATADDRAPTEATLAGLGVADLVDAITCADDGLPVKPAADGILHLCRELEVSPSRTAMIGDSASDVAMGRAAGAALVIGVLSGVGTAAELEPYADEIIPSIGALVAH